MAKLLDCQMIKKSHLFLERLFQNFGKTFVLLMFAVYLGLKGFIASSVSLSFLPYLKNTLGVNEKTYQVYTMIAMVPWSIKAFIGSLSDLYPLGGYHGKYYMVGTSIIGAIALAVIGVLPLKGVMQIAAPLLLFMVMLQITVVDLLCEAKYATALKNKSKQAGGDIISFVWGCVVLGSFIASSFVGVFTDYFSASYVYLICLPLSVMIIYPIARNYLGETEIPKEEIKFNYEKLKKNQHIFILAMAMALFALGMAAINLMANEHVVLTYSLAVSIILCLLALWSQEATNAKCNIYLFLVEATYIQIPGAMDYWYTADESCVKGGTAFDMTYYLTYTNMLGSIASIIGIIIFQRKMAKWRFRRSFLISTMIRISSSIFDIFIITRTNLKFGIPDKVAYLLGDALILNTASMMASMPAIMLTASIVNSSLATTTYAILAGFQNFGSNISKSLGLALMSYFEIDADSRPCKFDKLPQLIFLCHSVLPLLPLAVMPFLIGSEGNEGDGAIDKATNEAYGLLAEKESIDEELFISSDSGRGE